MVRHSIKSPFGNIRAISFKLCCCSSPIALCKSPRPQLTRRGQIPIVEPATLLPHYLRRDLRALTLFERRPHERMERSRHRRFENLDTIPAVSICSKHGFIRSPRRQLASSPGGKLRPNALAVLRLITNSNLIDCMTGRSAGFSPLRIRPVYTPAWRYASVMLVP